MAFIFFFFQVKASLAPIHSDEMSSNDYARLRRGTARRTAGVELHSGKTPDVSTLKNFNSSGNISFESH